jgi:hypothetical protein
VQFSLRALLLAAAATAVMCFLVRQVGAWTVIAWPFYCSSIAAAFGRRPLAAAVHGFVFAYATLAILWLPMLYLLLVAASYFSGCP